MLKTSSEERMLRQRKQQAKQYPCIWWFFLSSENNYQGNFHGSRERPALLIYSSDLDHPHQGTIGHFIVASKGSVTNSFLKWSLLFPRGISQITMCLQYSIWLKFNKLCYWQINYLFQCCCQRQTECFEQRSRIDTKEIAINNSQ